MAGITLAQVYAGLHYADGSRWTGPTLSFSIPTASSLWSPFSYPQGDEPSNVDFGVLTTSQGSAFRLAMFMWDRLINLNFVEVPDDATGSGQIRIAFTDTSDYLDPGEDAAAYAYPPPVVGSGTAAFEGDIWIDGEYRGEEFEFGGFLFLTLLHEIGHVLGLKHPFEDTLLPTEFDNTRYTVMAYNDFDDAWYRFFYLENGQVTGATFLVQPTTPMPLDILAIQGLYGAATNIEQGATTYEFDTRFPVMETVVDSGGIDTFDMSDHTRPSVVNLTPGAFSSIGYLSIEAQLAFWRGQFPDTPASFFSDALNRPGGYTWSNNVATSQDTVIENVRAGSGNDTINGNVADNSLSGGAGSDQIYGSTGNDIIEGGSAWVAGNYLRGDEGNDSITGGNNFDDANGNMGNDTVATGDGDDFCVGGKDNDVLFGDEGNDFVYGNLGDDSCTGGGGNDTVRGGQGTDALSGGGGNDFVSGDRGDDTMTGGAGADIFHSSSDAGIDRILDFSLADGDRVLLDPGTAFTVMQVGGDTIVQMSNAQVVLVGFSMSSLSAGTIFGA